MTSTSLMTQISRFTTARTARLQTIGLGCLFALAFAHSGSLAHAGDDYFAGFPEDLPFLDDHFDDDWAQEQRVETQQRSLRQRISMSTPSSQTSRSSGLRSSSRYQSGASSYGRSSTTRSYLPQAKPSQSRYTPSSRTQTSSVRPSYTAGTRAQSSYSAVSAYADNLKSRHVSFGVLKGPSRMSQATRSLNKPGGYRYMSSSAASASRRYGIARPFGR